MFSTNHNGILVLKHSQHTNENFVRVLLKVKLSLTHDVALKTFLPPKTKWAKYIPTEVVLIK